MKIKELIEILKTYPEDSGIVVQHNHKLIYEPDKEPIIDCKESPLDTVIKSGKCIILTTIEDRQAKDLKEKLK